MRSERELIDSHTARVTSWAMAGVLLAMIAIASFVVLAALDARSSSEPDCPPGSTAPECVDGD